jgi:hypothetical protein
MPEAETVNGCVTHDNVWRRLPDGEECENIGVFRDELWKRRRTFVRRDPKETAESPWHGEPVAHAKKQ